MPKLDHGTRPVSHFEFWPLWLMYVPVALQWLALALWHRSLTLPLIANPKLPVSGMVGIGKHEIMQQATGPCADAILPWIHYVISADEAAAQASDMLQLAAHRNIGFPFVCKPDIGCRGSGVKLIHDYRQLENYVAAYPAGAGVLIQKLASWEPEAGVFFVRHPEATVGRVVSLALKYSPYVVGDGVSTLDELISRDPRAGKVRHLYAQRFQHRLQEVLPDGERLRLVFSISHCRGAIFRDAANLITPALTDRINELMAGLPEFHYGRLDIKFPDTYSLVQGRNIEIVEINAASSESLHIWDRSARLPAAVSTLLWQYRTLFDLGARNRRRGFRPPSVGELLRRWRSERALTRHHPATD
ncbi:MAG: hypothetical protein L0Y45_05320 [Woeseiaceae bacterium]|nr:hypothetical protein [Woeseiaceae bacterium]